MTVKIYPEPQHEPVGFSDEVFPPSHRWRYAGIAILVVLAAAVTASFLL